MPADTHWYPCSHAPLVAALAEERAAAARQQADAERAVDAARSAELSAAKVLADLKAQADTMRQQVGRLLLLLSRIESVAGCCCYSEDKKMSHKVNEERGAMIMMSSPCFAAVAGRGRAAAAGRAAGAVRGRGGAAGAAGGRGRGAAAGAGRASAGGSGAGAEREWAGLGTK